MADTVVVDRGSNSDSAAGWVVALVIVVAVAVAGFVWYRNGRPTPSTDGGTNINVTIPSPVGGAGPNPAQ